MRNVIRTFACLSLVLVALNAGAQSADQSLQRVIADFERLQRQSDPIGAGQEGDREALRRLPDVTPEADWAPVPPGERSRHGTRPPLPAPPSVDEEEA